MTSAIYFDGQSARLHPVELETTGGVVVVNGPGVARVYPAGQTRLAEPFEHAPAVLHFSDGTRCEVSGAARDELARVLGYRKPRVVRWQAHWPAALVALALLVALILVTTFWGVPLAAERIADRLPASVDTTLGRSALEALERQGFLLPTRFSDERVEQIQQVLKQVSPQHPRIPMRLLVRTSKQFGANALALPDGTIVVTDAMVRTILGKSQDFDAVQTAQLAGVLAHEIGHIERRHSARIMTRTSLTAALSAALFGDFSAVAAGAPTLLLNMSYSREMETEADDYAIAVLQQKAMPLAPLADLFEELEDSPEAQVQRILPRWLSDSLDYASSHPATADRIARLRKAGKP